MDIQVLGAHNCESQDSKCVSLLIDDVLALDAGSLTSSLSFANQQKLKAILVTHQHYDHVKDIPAIAMNFTLQQTTISLHSIQAVYDALSAHLLNGTLYPKFLERPQGNPTIKFSAIEPHQVVQIEGYDVLAIPVDHSVSAVGYQITSPDGKTMFYSGDAGPGLAKCWADISPHLLITEVTAPNRYENFARESGHLTPNLLKQELTSFQELKGYLPRVILVHINPYLEKEIEAEITALAKALDTSIALAYEGMRLHL